MGEKKKTNPNIFTFVTDPTRGLFSPFKTILKAAVDATITKSAQDALDEVERDWGNPDSRTKVPYKPTKVYDVKHFESITDALLAESDSDFDAAARTVAFFSAMPFVDLEQAIMFFERKPFYRADKDTAYNIRMRNWNYLYEPLSRRGYYKKYTPIIPEPYRLALAAAKGLLDDAKYIGTMAENGFNAKWADTWKLQNYLSLPTEFLLMMLRRGVITEADFYWLGSYAPYDTTTLTSLLGMKDVIPPITDLIRFAVREAFGTHTYIEQYPEFLEWAGKMGLTEYMAGAYWYAHWERIPIQQMYDNLWRGNWTEEEFMRMLRIKDLHPDDRQAILDVAFRPLSIREMGYAYDVGAIKHEDIVRYRRMGGLSEEDAGKAATALIDYRLHAEREAIRREHLHLFAMEKITEEEFIAALKLYRTPEEAIPLWVTRGHLERTRKLSPPIEYVSRGITRGTAQWLYEHGVKDLAWFRETLVDIDTAPEAIEAYVAQSKQRMKEKEEDGIEPTYRKLTLTQIRDLLLMGRIDPTELPAVLEKIGYSPDAAIDIEQLILADVIEKTTPKMLTRTDVQRMYDMRVFTEKEVSEYYKRLNYSERDAANLTLWTKINVEFPDLRAMYRNGWITSDTLVKRLKELGLTEERATEFALTVVKYDQPERMTKERDLTKAEILKGRKKDIINTNQAMGLLMDLGYDENEAYYLLALNDVIVVHDPESYWQMRKATEAYKRARGEKFVKIPDEVLILEKNINEQRDKIKNWENEGYTDDQLAVEQQALEQLKQQLRSLLQKTKLV